jgi:hypothetical protein
VEPYSQDAESLLLESLLVHLDDRSMIAVGSGQERVAQAMLGAGLETMYAFELDPESAARMREIFAEDARLLVREVEPAAAGATLQCAVRDSEVPRRVGVLQLAAAREGLALLRAAHTIEADVICMQHWLDVPGELGACEWTVEEVVAELRPRGFSSFAFVAHQGEFATFEWQGATVERGAIGSLVFVRDVELQQLLPELLSSASRTAQQALRTGRAFERAWRDREQLVTELRRAADERLKLVDELNRTCEERLVLIEQLERICAERLAVIEQLTEGSGPVREPA